MRADSDLRSGNPLGGIRFRDGRAGPQGGAGTFERARPTGEAVPCSRAS